MTPKSTNGTHNIYYAEVFCITGGLGVNPAMAPMGGATVLILKVGDLRAERAENFLTPTFWAVGDKILLR